MDLETLNMHIMNLSVQSETEDAMISCYINNEAGRASYRDVINTRIREIRKVLSSEQRLGFEQALGRIETFLATEVNPEAKGVALFSRAGESPFFQALQFSLPLPNLISVDSVPHIYELVVLKDTYDRYVVLISTESHARIIEVSVGNVTTELWAERPDLRKRVGREWTKEHYQSHRRDRSQKFMKEKIEILDRLFAEEAHTHLVLAGNPRSVARVRDSLPRHLEEKLIDIVQVSDAASSADVASATLAAFVNHEQRESQDTAKLLLNQLRRGDLAVAGTEASLKALAQGQVDVLVLSESYVAPDGWRCRDCEAVGVNVAPTRCTQCFGGTVGQLDLREYLTSTAVRFGSTVEIVRESDVPLEVGGVGCLLRYLTSEQYAVATTSRRLFDQQGAAV